MTPKEKFIKLRKDIVALVKAAVIETFFVCMIDPDTLDRGFASFGEFERIIGLLEASKQFFIQDEMGEIEECNPGPSAEDSDAN